LYSSIQALLEEKFIQEVVQAGEAGVHPERRRFYRLTGTGES
jgi:hypothetical protein